MPSHKVHKALAKALLGDDWEIVNLFKDAPYRLFPGPKHREYFHDDATNFLLGALYGPDAMLAGFLHDWADENFVERDGKVYWKTKAPERLPKKRRKKRTLSKRSTGKKLKF